MAKPKFRTCEVAGCSNKHYGQGMCGAHYRRMQRHGTLGELPIAVAHGRSNASRCNRLGCEAFAVEGGYCNEHYRQEKNKRPKRRCFVAGCTNLYYVNGCCKKHHNTTYKYKISVIQYSAMFIDGCCEVCGSKDFLVLDHDHKCCGEDDKYGSKPLCGNCNRGILCSACNKAIGFARDSVSNLEKMIGYLRG